MDRALMTDVEDGYSAEERQVWRMATDKRLDLLELGLETNTGLTVKLNTKMTNHMIQMEPVVNAVVTMQAGVNVIGKIGEAVAWLGKTAVQVGRWAVGLAVLYVGAKVLLTTGSWEKAVDAVSKWLK